MSRDPHPLFVVVLVLLVELAWSFNSVAAKLGLRQLDPLAMASFRIVLAGLIAVPVYLLAPRPVKIERRDLKTFALLGLFGVAINQGCFTAALNYTTVGHSAVIIGIGPIFVLLLARALRLETLTAPKLLGMALSFTGVAILATEYGIHLHSGTLAGDLITLAGSFGFALYTVLGKKVIERFDTVAMVSFNHIAAAVILLPLAVRQGLRLDWGGVGWEGWLPLMYMAAIGSIAAYLIFYWALRHMSASRLAAFSYLLPFLATLQGVLLLHEALTASFLAGGALVLVGVYVAQRGAGIISE